MTIVTCAISAVICLALPLVLCFLFARKHKQQCIVSAWLLGAAGFFVTQILIRVPVITLLQSQSWFMEFANSQIFAYVFSLAFTAGLFELAGRFGVAKILEKKLTWNRTLAIGLGHGGIESIYIAGITMINNLAYIAMINAGTFDETLAMAAASGVDVTQLEMIKTQLITSSPALFLLGGFERILTMIVHAAMSALVCYGVVHKKVLPCTLVCLCIHTFIDLTAGLTLVLPQTTAYMVIYTILAAVAIFSVLVLKNLHHRWTAAPVVKGE
jgi:uncharacterized membrane protein YhfC